MPTVSLPEWSEFISNHPEAHILQHPKWGELKASFNWNPIHFISGQNGSQILMRHLPFGLKMAYIPKGPLGKDWVSLLGDIQQYCLQNKISFIKIEPDDSISVEDVSHMLPEALPSPQTIQPRRTISVELHDEPAKLLERMKQKTRYNIGLAVKKGVTIHPWNDVNKFHKMMQTTGERDAFGIHSLNYYQKSFRLFHPVKMCELLAAKHEGEVLAAAMIFKSGNRSWYFYGASGNAKRHLMPTYLLQWQAMLWAKNNGCGWYDLWGVPDYDEDFLENHFNERQDGLWGVYRFKRGFGGKLIRSAGAFDLVFDKVSYQLYKIYLKFFRALN